MENSVIVLWSLSSTLNFIFASVLTAVTLTPKYKNSTNNFLWAAASFILSAITIVWYSFFKPQGGV